MKKILLPVLACGMFASAFSQTEPAEPCCNVVSTDIKNNTVIARDNTTGRLYQFKADALDMKAVKLKDAVNIVGGKVTSISGSKRMYVTVRPDPVEPCCGIVNIQPDPAEPCCSNVEVKNNTKNNTSKISVVKQVAATLKIGQPVSINSDMNMVIVQSAYGNSNGQMNSFGYPATSGNANDKWILTKVPAMKGVLGSLDINFPSDVERNIIIHKNSDKEYITSVSRNDKTFHYSPGVYRFVLSTVPVDDVPIQKGYITRLKAGILNIVSEGNWTLYDANKEIVFTTGNKPKKMPLPVGSYQLKLGDQFYPFVIKDKEAVEL